MTDQERTILKTADETDNREQRDYSGYAEWCESLGITPATIERWRVLRGKGPTS